MIEILIVIIVEIILLHVLYFPLKEIINLVTSPYTWEYYVPLKVPRDTL